MATTKTRKKTRPQARIPVLIRVEQDLLDYIDGLCYEQRRTRSNLISLHLDSIRKQKSA